MATGDNKISASAVAKECGIMTSDHEDAVLEGPTFFERIGGSV